jgi:hypothetical protein
MSDNGGDRAKEIDEKEQTEEVDSEAMEEIRQALLETTLEVDVVGDDNVNKSDAISRYLVRLRQGNDTVQKVLLHLQKDYHRDYGVLECLGNLGALQVLTISRCKDDDDYCEADAIIFWQAFAGALSRVQHHIMGTLGSSFNTSLILQRPFKVCQLSGLSIPVMWSDGFRLTFSCPSWCLCRRWRT